MAVVLSPPPRVWFNGNHQFVGMVTLSILDTSVLMGSHVMRVEGDIAILRGFDPLPVDTSILPRVTGSWQR